MTMGQVTFNGAVQPLKRNKTLLLQKMSVPSQTEHRLTFSGSLDDDAFDYAPIPGRWIVSRRSSTASNAPPDALILKEDARKPSPLEAGNAKRTRFSLSRRKSTPTLFNKPLTESPKSLSRSPSLKSKASTESFKPIKRPKSPTRSLSRRSSSSGLSDLLDPNSPDGFAQFEPASLRGVKRTRPESLRSITSNPRSFLESWADVLTPNLSLREVTELTPKRLAALGSGRGLLFDLDNTLMPFFQGGFSQDMLQSLTALQKAGYRLGVVSNNISKSYCEVAQKALEREGIRTTWVLHANKPAPAAFQMLSMHWGMPLSEMTMVGDSNLADVYGARRLGLKAVQVSWYAKQWWAHPAVVSMMDVTGLLVHRVRSTLGTAKTQLLEFTNDAAQALELPPLPYVPQIKHPLIGKSQVTFP